MGEKKYCGRFCIQFNSADPRHLQVVELLEGQGRRKANFIAEAVLHYTGESQSNTAGINPAALKSMVSAIVRECLKKESSDKNTALPVEPSVLPDEPETFESVSVPLNANDFDPDLLAAVKESIASSRKE